MSKKKKTNSFAKELNRQTEKYLMLKNPFFNTEPFLEYCEKIKEAAHSGCDDFIYKNFIEHELYSPSGFHNITEAVAVLSPMYADSSWITSSAEDVIDSEIYIGVIDNPVTYLPEKRAFWRFKVEEIKEDRLLELESIHMASIADYYDEANDVTATYALLTAFVSGTMLELDFREAPSVNLIKEFISSISSALKYSPQNGHKDMPTKEAFNELLSKLIALKRGNSIHPVDEDNDTLKNEKIIRPRNQVYPKELKLDIVKRIKAKQLTVAQAVKEIGGYHSLIYQWIWSYDKNGENAFIGRSNVSPHPDKRELIAELFKDFLLETVTSKTTPTADADKYDILNLPYDKEKMLESCSYQQRKFDDEFRLKTVKLIKEHQLPVSQVSDKLNIDDSVLNRWLQKYENHGENAFTSTGSKSHDKQNAAAPRSKKKALYNDRYKMAAVKYVKDNNLSPYQAAEELGIKKTNMYRWLRKVEEHGENAFANPVVYYEDLDQTISELHNKQNINAPVQSNPADVSIPCTDSVPEKEEKAVYHSKERMSYGQQYKMAVVKYIKDNNLSPFQVAKELGIKYVNVGKWIRLYEEHGENAFPGAGVYRKNLTPTVSNSQRFEAATSEKR